MKNISDGIGLSGATEWCFRYTFNFQQYFFDRSPHVQSITAHWTNRLLSRSSPLLCAIGILNFIFDDGVRRPHESLLFGLGFTTKNVNNLIHSWFIRMWYTRLAGFVGIARSLRCAHIPKKPIADEFCTFQFSTYGNRSSGKKNNKFMICMMNGIVDTNTHHIPICDFVFFVSRWNDVEDPKRNCNDKLQRNA